MIAVRYHDTVKFLQGRNWLAPSPFARAEWLSAIAASGTQPIIAAAEDGAEWAALPLTQANGRLESLVNWYNFSWHPLGDAKLFEPIAQDLRKRTHRVTLWPLADEDGSATYLEKAFRGAGWHVARTRCDHNHILPVNGRSFADYWASRPGKMRTTLKRKAKKVDVEILTRFDAEIWADYEAIYASSWKPEEGDPALLRHFAEAEGAAGRIRLGIARHEETPVAAQFWTVEQGTAYTHKLAHLDEHKALSAGTTLTAALFERVIDTDKVDLVDFGIGNDPYKRDWMEQDRPRFRLDCLDPRQPRAWPALIKRRAKGTAVRLARAVRRS